MYPVKNTQVIGDSVFNLNFLYATLRWNTTHTNPFSQPMLLVTRIFDNFLYFYYTIQSICNSYRVVAMKADCLFSFRLLAQACFGVMTGAFIALLVASVLLPIGGRPLVMPDEMLSWNLHNTWPKPREKGFYVLSIIFGTVGAYLTTSRIYKGKLFNLCLGLIISVPLINYFAQHLSTKNHHVKWLLLVSIMAIISLLLRASRNSKCFIPYAIPVKAENFSWRTYLLFLILLTLIVIPKSYTTIAARIGTNFHAVSFLIGPSLYFLADENLPGVDYFTQYSIGFGWLFSHFLSSSVKTTLLNYTHLIVIAIWLFYAQLLYLLYWLYRSWMPAITVAFLALFLFHTETHFLIRAQAFCVFPC